MAEDLKTLRQLEPLILELENRNVPGKSINRRKAEKTQLRHMSLR